MKYRISILLAFLEVFVISACSTADRLEDKYKGKQINPNNFKYLSNNGHHFQKLKHFDIDYNYSIDTESKKITLEGTAIYTVPYEERKYRSEQVLLKVSLFEIILVFADLSGKVVAVESFYFNPNSSLVDPIQFKGTVPYESHYDLIYFGYSFRSQGDQE